MVRYLSAIFCLCLPLSLLAQANFQLTTAEKKRIVTGSEAFDKSDQEIFANALLWAIERGEQRKELVTELDYGKMRLVLQYQIRNTDATSFAGQLTLQVAQGRLVYLVSGIKGQGTGLSGLLGAFSLDKLDPEKKPKQKAVLEEFEAANKQQLQGLLTFVRETTTDVSHWKEITDGHLEKGLSRTDVLLILGKPVDTQRAGKAEQLMYDTFTYVFLEDGIVKSFMQ